MTGSQRWTRDVWTARLGMLCFVAVIFAGAWGTDFVSPYVWLLLVLAAAVLLLAARRFQRPSWHERYGPLLTSTEKIRLAALSWQREVLAALGVIVVMGGALVANLVDFLGAFRHPVLIGLLAVFAVQFAWSVRLKAAEWSVYSRIARDV